MLIGLLSGRLSAARDECGHAVLFGVQEFGVCFGLRLILVFGTHSLLLALGKMCLPCKQKSDWHSLTCKLMAI